MGLLFPEDPHYNENERQTGFYRYRQLLSNRFGQWWKINLLTLAGFAPLAVGIFYAVLRGLRDDPTPWLDGWKRSWRQNWRGSMLLGAVMGLLAGLYAFMGMLFWWAETGPSMGTIGVYLAGLLLILAANTLLWPQIVLFRQTPAIRLRNALLFLVRYFWRVMGTGILQLAHWAVYVLFAPWTLLLLPVTGVWYIVFLSQFLVYEQMDEALRIEELYDENK